MRVSCANNEKQLGIGANVYATDNGDYLPIINWPNSSSERAYQTSLACRMPSGQVQLRKSAPDRMALVPYFFMRALITPEYFIVPAFRKEANML